VGVAATSQVTFPRGILAAMGDVTQILSAIEQGDSQAAKQLFPLVYDELRRLAAHNGIRAAIFSPRPPRPCGEFWSKTPAA
jgi:hypothetical protein